MNANQIIDESMSLDEKLSAIEEAMQKAQEQAKEEASRKGQEYVPLDPADLVACDSCQ